MKSSDKIRVAILFGGRSAEHEISIQSALNVINHLDPTLFDILPIGIDKTGNWFAGHNLFEKSLENKEVGKLNENIETWFSPDWIAKPEKHTSKALSTTHSTLFDVVFPVVHGSLCEDGTLQGLLEIADLPYVGCGVLASAVGMDKDVAKRLCIQAGIHVGPYLAIKFNEWQQNNETYCQQIAEQLSFPVFVKPANTGSSIGITKVKTKENLISAINYAFKFDTKILVEKALNIMECEIAVLESLENASQPIVSVVGEIKSHHEFYSYDAKYTDEKGADIIIPAPIPEHVQEEARKMAHTIFLTLECEGMARIDLFWDKTHNQLYFNEINTIPGFTKISMYPKLMEASGIPYAQLLTHLIQLAMKKHKIKSRLIRSYESN